MTKVQNIFFDLLRVAIGTKRAEEVAASIEVEGSAWQEVYLLARKQGVLAITFDGLLQLMEVNESLAQSLPKPLKLQWINASFSIEKRYEHSRTISAEIAEKWAERGVKTVCMKGMAFSTYYPVPSHRECGDFDCYLFDDYAKGNNIARELGIKVVEEFYKHSEFVYKRLMIENHQYMVATRDSKKARSFNALLDGLLREEGACQPLFDTKILMPPAMFNALFMTYHTYTHFLQEDIRLRHILDWALLLRSEQSTLDWGKFYAICEEQHLRAFVDVQTALAVEVFGVEITNSAVTTTSPYTERVLDSILYDNMAIFSQNVGKWRMRMLVLRNLFAARWKYKAFSNRGVVGTFLSLLRGYLFHTEK